MMASTQRAEPEARGGAFVRLPRAVPGERPRSIRLAQGRIGVLSAAAWLLLLAVAALFADLLPLARYDVPLDGLPPRAAPAFTLDEPFGTDQLGRSMLSRLVFGARESLTVGLCSAGIATIIGLTIGVTAGYFRGKIDALVAVVLDAVLAIPPVALLLAIAAVGRRSLWPIVIGLSVIGVPTIARLARASTIPIAGREYVLAATTMGASRLRIVLREIVPNVVLPVSTYSFIFMAYAIVAEASLSFLGLGVPPPAPSWGGMANDGRAYLSDSPFLVFEPVACLVLTILALTIVSDYARRRFDVGESGLA